MKHIGKIILSLLCIILPLTGCSSAPSSEPVQTYVAPVPPFTVQDNTIRIISLPLSLFETILQDPDTSALATNVCQESVFSASKNMAFYYTQNASLLRIEPSFWEIWGNQSSINEYLQDSGIQETVEECVFLDVFHVPITIWIKTASSHLFITVSYQYQDFGETQQLVYDYTLYSQEDYAREFCRLEAKLIIDGEEVCGNNKNVLYHDSSVVPLLPALKAMGISVTKIGNLAIFSHRGACLLADTHKPLFYRFGSLTEGLLHDFLGGDGGPRYDRYIENEEIMVDDLLLGKISYHLGIEASITLDRESQTITITTS